MKFWLYSSAFVGCCLGVTVLFFNISAMDEFKCIFASCKELERDEPSTSILKKCNFEKECLASSVWCVNRPDGSNLCRFENLYHLPLHQGFFFFFMNEYSVISGVKSIENLKTLELSTVKNHSAFHLKLVIVESSEYLLLHNLVFINDEIFLMKRFKPDNIMHVIHDDILPLYFTYKELCKGNVNVCLSIYKLLFIDDFGKGPYYEWYQSFSHYESIFIVTRDEAICFSRITLGLNPKSVWFQYGFKNVQGPSFKTDLNAIELKQFADFIIHQFHIVKETLPSDQKDSKKVIFLNRKINRRILNESIVVEHIKKMNNKYIVIFNMDLSVNSSKDLISAMQKTNYLIGMHGSAIIMSIFMPQGSNIIELFPFGIQPKFVSPLKALCSLPTIFYNYHSWVNENENNTITHPEYPPLLGGLLHLPLLEQEQIKATKLVPPVECCHNPHYLFKMFQDTIVDESFYSLVFSVLNNITKITLTDEKINEIIQMNMINSWYYPPPVFNLSCDCNEANFIVKWSYPIVSTAKITFNVATSTGITTSGKDTYFDLISESCYKDNTQTNIVKAPISVWVKAIRGNQESVDSHTQCV
uniref:Glycosyltransferase 61 catalytic domain-containing protein n=1 Tax=Graphocephala atropunctata TaxID=36148 RepID=A0A1B6LCJ0_9HEMI